MSRRVVGEGSGDRAAPCDVDSGEAELGQAFGSLGSVGVGAAEDAAGGASGGDDEASVRIGFSITLRRVRIRPREKREEYVARLEQIIGLCEAVLNDSGSLEHVQLKAADVIIRAIRMGYTIVREVDVENLERIAAEIKERLAERDRKSGQETEGGEEPADPL